MSKEKMTGEEAGKLVAEICMNHLDYDVDKAWIDAGRPHKTEMYYKALGKRTVELYADLVESKLGDRVKQLRKAI